MEDIIDIKQYPRGNRTVLRIAGDLDLAAAPQLRETVNELLAAGRHHIVVDLQHTAFLDSTGLGVLVGTLKRARAVGGSVELVTGEPSTLKIFQITGLVKVFKIYPKLADVPPELP